MSNGSDCARIPGQNDPAPRGVFTIDCQYIEPRHTAAYLIVDHGRAAFIDNNTVHAVPLLMEALAGQGLTPDCVDYIIITHLHLDHAGGTSVLAEQCPSATVLAHPRSVRHLTTPSRLIAAVKDVYGADWFDSMYAPINPIDPARVRAVEDGATVRLGERTLSFLHTRGHAKHHICIIDSASNGAFTGDTFGVGFRPWRSSPRPFLVFSTAPSDFDPAAARDTVRRLADSGIERAYLSHYGELGDIPNAAVSLLDSIDQMEAIAREAAAAVLTGENLLRFCRQSVAKAAREMAEVCGAVLSEEEWLCFDNDMIVDAQGLALYAASLQDKP